MINLIFSGVIKASASRMVFTRTRSTAIGAAGATGPNVQEPVESAYLFRLGLRINFYRNFEVLYNSREL